MKNAFSVIQYEGDNSTFIWKHPCEDFHTNTQLIVHESQQAMFMLNGEALDVFEAGRHTLETQNIPLLSKLLNRLTSDKTPFHCEVYFINKTVQMAIKWGTDSRVRYIDPEYGIPLEIGACGEMNLQVSDARRLLIKLVGTTSGIAWDNDVSREAIDVSDENDAQVKSNFTNSLKESFRPIISQAVKSNLSRAIEESNIDLFEIDKYLEELSSKLREKLLPAFEEYGLTIPQFFLSRVLLPEEDENFQKLRYLRTISLKKSVASADAQIVAAEREVVLEKEQTEIEKKKKEAEREIIDAQVEAQKTQIQGFAEAEVMKAKGYTEKDVIEAEVQKAYAEGLGNFGANGGGGSSAMSDVLGIGVGLQAAGAMGSKIGNIFNGFGGSSQENESAPLQPQTVTCSNCGASCATGAKFCVECGQKIVVVKDNEIVCPSCGEVTGKGKFCQHCGASLVKVCPNCGVEISGNGKFCIECGTKLD